MTTSTQQPVMDENAINRLENEGATAILAAALRNIIRCTDDATEVASNIANQRQEYVPVVVFKGAIYAALDAALHGKPYAGAGADVLATFDDENELPEPDPAAGTDYRPLARALQVADDEWTRLQENGEDDPDVAWAVFVAQYAQGLMDADQKARSQPVESRGTGS